jgi:hypothetical protein
LHVSSLTANIAGFLSADKKAFILNAPTEKKMKGPLEVETRFKVSLRMTVLRPRYDGEEFIKVRPLSAKERFLQLASSSEVQYKVDEFQMWLGKYQMLINMLFTGESHLHFARRAFVFIVKQFQLVDDALTSSTGLSSGGSWSSFPIVGTATSTVGANAANGASASTIDAPLVSLPGISSNSILAIAQRGSGTEEELHRLYVGIMRCADIPARVCYGRTLSEGKLGARAQFFVELVGWVPVNLAASMRDPVPALATSDADDSQRSWGSHRNRMLLSGFGNSDTTFLAFSHGKHLVETPVYGPRMLDACELSLDFEHKNRTTTMKQKKLPSDSN